MQRARIAVLLVVALAASMVASAASVFAAASLSVTATSPITVGATTNATATLSGSSEGGTITVALYSDSGCSTPLGGITEGFTVTGDDTVGPLATGYATTAVGSVYWQASFVGDDVETATSSCTEVVVQQATPDLSTTPSPTTGTGPIDLNDSATLTGSYNATGTITFKLFPPADATCASTEVYSEGVSVSGDNTYSTTGGGTGDNTAALAGVWHWTADYPGDTNNAGDSSACADEAVSVYIDTSVVYAGQTYDADGGANSTLSANLASIDPVCLEGDVDFTLTDLDGNVLGPFQVHNTSPSTFVQTSQAIGSGLYEVHVSFDPDNAYCNASSDDAVLAVVSPGDAANGGGWYKNTDVSPPRIDFGFTVQKQYNKRTDTTIYRGQLLWINSHSWRLKGTIYSNSADGDDAAFGTFDCPSGVGSLGPPSSNPKCGSFTGAGVLQVWREDKGGWVDSDYGDDGVVTFTATVYDGGTISVCKGKKNCTKTDLADWFGIQIDPVPATDVPESAPIKIMKGSIKVN